VADVIDEEKYARFQKWANSYMQQHDIDPQDVDMQSDFNSGISLDENYSAFAQKHPSGATRVQHQYGSRNYAAEMERKEEEAREQAYFEEKKTTPYNPPHKELPGREKEFKGNIPHEKPGADVSDIVEPEPKAKPSFMGGVSGWIEERKIQFGLDEGTEARRLKEREYGAKKDIVKTSERLEVRELEDRAKALKKKEFEGSPMGRVLKGIQGDHAARGGYGYAASNSGEVSPMKSALTGRQETPMWLQAKGTPGWMGGNMPAQRSAIMAVTMGGGYQGNRGYQGNQPRPPRRKVITVNGRTYVVQHEPKAGGYSEQPVQSRSMLQETMYGSPTHNQSRQPPHVSPLMQAAMSGGHQTESPSPMMQAHMGKGPSSPLMGALINPESPSRSNRAKRSPLQSTMEGNASPKKKGGFKWF
jgi:hypothetical protein